MDLNIFCVNVLRDRKVKAKEGKTTSDWETTATSTPDMLIVLWNMNFLLSFSFSLFLTCL